jgi:hypothetical protein
MNMIKMVTGRGKQKFRTKTYPNVIISNANQTLSVLALIFAIKCQRITTCFVCRLLKILLNLRLCLVLNFEAVRRKRLQQVINFMSVWRDAGQHREVSVRPTATAPRLELATTGTQANRFVAKLVHPWYSPMF